MNISNQVTKFLYVLSYVSTLKQFFGLDFAWTLRYFVNIGWVLVPYQIVRV